MLNQLKTPRFKAFPSFPVHSSWSTLPPYHPTTFLFLSPPFSLGLALQAYPTSAWRSVPLFEPSETATPRRVLASASPCILLPKGLTRLVDKSTCGVKQWCYRRLCGGTFRRIFHHHHDHTQPHRSRAIMTDVHWASPFQPQHGQSRDRRPWPAGCSIRILTPLPNPCTYHPHPRIPHADSRTRQRLTDHALSRADRSNASIERAFPDSATLPPHLAPVTQAIAHRTTIHHQHPTSESQLRRMPPANARRRRHNQAAGRRTPSRPVSPSP